MGFGLPGGPGSPDRPSRCKIVIDIAGDGSIQMNIQELATAVEYQLPVKVAILNNQFLGMVRQWQQLFYDRRYCATAMNVLPRTSSSWPRPMARWGSGRKSRRRSRPLSRKALDIKQPVIMDFRVEPEECVYPMVPAGAAISKMLLV